jgi:hypothetical protein
MGDLQVTLTGANAFVAMPLIGMTDRIPASRILRAAEIELKFYESGSL